MRNIIRIEEIRETETYKKLAEKKEIIKMGFLDKRSQREVITNGFAVWLNTKKIPGNVTGINLQIVKDLIEAHIKNIEVDIDRSFSMDCENI